MTWGQPLCGLLLVALLGAAAPFARPEAYSTKTDELLILCSNGGKACADLINDVLKSLNAASAIQPGRTYKGCAPAPLDPDQIDQVVISTSSITPERREMLRRRCADAEVGVIQASLQLVAEPPA